MKILHRVTLLAAVALIAVGLTPAVSAQTTATVGPGNGFRVSPVREELTIQPGKSETVDIGVENITNEDIIARPVVNDFVASDGEDGQPRLLLDDSKPTSGNSFKNLIGQLADLPLKPKERKLVKITVNVPANAAGGGYYGAIRFSPASGASQKQVSLTASVGVIFLVKVPGQIIEKLDLLALTANDKWHLKPQGGYEQRDTIGSFFFTSPDTVVIRLKNPGTIHLQPTGRIRVLNWRGKLISDEEFNGTDPRGNVLPASTRRIDTAMKDKASFGRYTIEANLGYGTGGGDLITAKATFWVLPVWFLILVGVIISLGVGGFFVWRFYHRKKRRYR